MSPAHGDRELRDLERAAARGQGDVAAAARLLQRRLRAGELDPERARWAAALGDPAAGSLGLEAVTGDPWRCLTSGLLGSRDLHLFACDCAEHVLPVYERERPDDPRPRHAVEVARRFHAAAGAAADPRALDAARLAFVRDLPRVGPGARSAAMAAGAACARRADFVAALHAARAAARLAAAAAEVSGGGRASERAWQQRRLARVLLEGPG